MASTVSTAGARERELVDFLERFVAEMQPLELRRNQASWLANTTGEARHEEESARLDAEIAQELELTGFRHRADALNQPLGFRVEQQPDRPLHR